MKNESIKEYGYAAALVFESSSSDPSDSTIYEEEIVMLEAGSKEEARERAITHAKAQENRYQNEKGDTITVSFKTLAGVCLMDEIRPGSTLYSRYFRDYDAYAAFQPLLAGKAL